MKLLREKNAFLPVSLILIFTLLIVFERIGLNSTQGYIYQLTLAFFALTYVSGKDLKTFHKWSIMLGFLFCFVGDLFLAGAFKDYPIDDMRMPLGMAGFFVGHIWWFIAILNYKEKIDKKKTLYTFLGVYVVIFLIWVFIINNPEEALLSPLALVYSWGIAAPFALSLALSYHKKLFIFLVIGYANLIFSDSIIGMRDINGLDPFGGWHDDLVWWTYLVGISAITYFFVRYKDVKEEK